MLSINVKWLLLTAAISQALWHVSNGQEYHGTEFHIMFMNNLVEAGIPEVNFLKLVVSNPNLDATTVSMGMPYDNSYDETVSIAARASYTFTLPYESAHHYPGVDKKGILIVSELPVTIVGANSLKFSTDTFLVLPSTSLGIGYAAACYVANINSHVGVVATLNETVITIALPPLPVGGAQFPIEVHYKGIYYSFGDSFQVMLNRSHTFLMSTKGDLTGATIKSNKRIAVFSGNIRAKLEGISRDHLVEQMLPYYSWSTIYVSSSTPGRSTGDVYRVLAKEPATLLTVKATATPDQTILISDPFEYREIGIISGTRAVFVGDKQIYVYRISKSVEEEEGIFPAGNLGDPSLSTLTSPSYWRRSYIFTYPRIIGGSFFNNHLTIYTREPRPLVLNGGVITPSYLSMANGYYVATVNVTDIGVTNIIAASFEFGLVLDGNADRESYSHVLGFDVIKSPEVSIHQRVNLDKPGYVCLVGRTVVPGDGIDNDCDSFIDEEEANGEDDDKDGLIDEDLGVGRTILSTGKDYVFMFMENMVEQINEVPMEVFIGGLDRLSLTNITVEFPLNGLRGRFSFHLFSLEVVRIEFHYTIMQKGIGVERKAVTINSDKDIVVYGMNKEQWSADGFLALATTTLSKEYLTMSYFPPTSSTQFAVVALQNSTNVTVSLPPLSHSMEQILVSFMGRTYSNGDKFWVVLDALETLQIQTDLSNAGDLSGTMIQASENIAVFSGNIRTAVKVGTEGKSRDHLVEQMPPTLSYGTKFATMTTPERTVGDVYKIVASSDATTIRICHRFADSIAITCSNEFIPVAGGHLRLDVNSSCYQYIETNFPVLVVMISRSQIGNNDETSEHADPAMIIIPPIEQYSANYTFLTPTVSKPETVGDYRFHFLMVIIEDQFTPGLQVDGNLTAFDGVDWQPIPTTDLVAGYINLPFGLHTLTHTLPDVLFMSILYGVADRESYGFPIGLKLSDLGICRLTEQNEGDGIDNDCDGQIDEEICHDSIDNDLDGRHDEDCLVIPQENKYVVGFMDNLVEEPLNFPLRLYAVSPNEQHVRVYTPLHSYKGKRYDHTEFVAAGGILDLGFGPHLRHYGSNVDKNAIVVESETPIRFYGSNKERFSHDAFLVLEMTELGTSYYTMSYWPSFLPEEFIVVPAINDTTVTITLSSQLTQPITFSGSNYTANQVINLVMDVGETAQIQSEFPTLAGSLIQSNRPIAVYSGNVRTMVGDSESRDHLVEMMLPYYLWASEYYAPSTPNRTEDDIFLVLVDTDTNLEVLANDGTISLLFLTAGVQAQINLPAVNSAYRFRAATGNCQIARVTASQFSPIELTDPAMMMIVPGLASEYYFVPPVATRSGLGYEYHNAIQIVAETSRMGGIRVDGKHIPPSNWISISTTGYSTTNYPIGSEQIPTTITHVDNMPFAAYAYGAADRESYALPLGL